MGNKRRKIDSTEPKVATSSDLFTTNSYPIKATTLSTETTTSPRHDDDGTVTSDQSNLEDSMNNLNKMNSSFDQKAEDNAETLENKVTAVTAYLLPRSTTQLRSKSSYRSSQQKKTD